MWNTYVSQPHSVADLYVRWSTMWEQYLREVTSSPGELTRHKPAKIIQDRIGGVSQSLSHAVRRLQNFVARLRKLQTFVHKGIHHFGLWRSVKTSSVYFSARYGAPVLNLHQMDELTCVAQVLKATEEHYEKFLEQELSKVSQNRRMAFRQRLHENRGVNKTMSAMLQARSTTELEIEHEGKRTVSYQDILDELMRSWKYLYDGQPALADGGWKDTYLNYPKCDEFPLKPLEAADLRAALKSAKKTSTPGPDGWRYSELGALPDVALQQLAQVFNAMEQQHELPDSLLSSWTAMINTSGKPVSPMKVRPISVLSVVYRLYAKSRLSTLEDWLDKALPPCIWSYIPGRDVRSPLMSLASRIENSQKPMVEEDTVLLSLDLSKAFPSASREQMWAALSHLGLPRPILDTLTSMYRHGRTRMRLGGRIVCDRDYSLRRGIHQGCPLSVMAFLGLQAQIPSLIAADCPSVSLIIFADDVTLVSDSVKDLEKAAQLIARYYNDCNITLNPQKTQLWSAKGRKEGIVLEGVQIEPSNRIKLLGVEYADTSTDILAQNDDPGLDLLMTETYRMQGLPIAMTHREAAFSGIIAKKVWYCPWKGVLSGQKLTKARAAIIRGVRPGLASSARLASLVTAFCLKGHVTDPVMISVLGILRWIQTMGNAASTYLHLLHCEDYTPRGPWTSLRFLCGEMGIRFVGGFASLEGHKSVPVLRDNRDKGEWGHEWRSILRMAISQQWLFRREFQDLSHARPDIERTLSYHRTLGNPQEKLCLEMVLSGAMLTRARVHKREPHLQGCVCGEGVDDDHHRYWNCKLVAKSREQLPDQMDDWPRITRLVGWVLEGDHHSLFQIKELQSHMLRVVSHFLHFHQKRTFLQDGEGCDNGGDDSGGGSRGASGGSGVPRQESDGDRPGEELYAGGGHPPPMQGRDAPQEGETMNWDGRKRGNKRTLPLPEHIRPTSRSVLPGQSAPKRLQCVCGTIALDANRTRFLQTHMGCAERPRKSRRVNVLTGAERREMEEVLGIPWGQHTQRAKRLAVEAAASH